MQFDKTRIAIRERSYFDLLDLALLAIRAHPLPLLAALAAGAAPMMLLNAWLLGEWVSEGELEAGSGWAAAYVPMLLLLVVLELPLATAPMTLYLGEALFIERPGLRRVAALFLRSLPQLLLWQVLLRAVLVQLLVTVVVVYAGWPYLSEVILLERNPLWRRSASGLSTWVRSQRLHGRNISELFARWLMALVLAGTWIAALWLAIWTLRNMLFARADFDQGMFTLHLQLAIWLVAGYFTVVRFLSYLDLRIRNEGWEIELRMRAEAARLQRHVA